MSREKNAIGCCGGNSDSGSLITHWKTYYDEKAETYSVSGDWWTLAPWKKHLFPEILDDLTGKMVVDIGCGTAIRVATLAPIQRHAYRYVGIDSSMAALKHAAVNMPGGLFVCTDLSCLQLQAQTADVVLCLGVLMYFPRLDPLLNQILRVLKPGGTLLLHEQLHRTSWGKLSGRALPSQHDCPPDGYGVRETELRVRLAQEGCVKHIHRSGSPFRGLAMRILDNPGFRKTRPLVGWLDELWCASIGRMVPDLGAGEIQIVFEKNK